MCCSPERAAAAKTAEHSIAKDPAPALAETHPRTYPTRKGPPQLRLFCLLPSAHLMKTTGGEAPDLLLPAPSFSSHAYKYPSAPPSSPPPPFPRLSAASSACAPPRRPLSPAPCLFLFSSLLFFSAKREKNPQKTQGEEEEAEADLGETIDVATDERRRLARLRAVHDAGIGRPDEPAAAPPLRRLHG